jgi:hypothetical protein
MGRGMRGLLADVNVQGHLPYLRRLMEGQGLLEQRSLRDEGCQGRGGAACRCFRRRDRRSAPHLRSTLVDLLVYSNTLFAAMIS